MAARRIPQTLRAVLRHARWLETQADGLGQQRHAIAATSAIMLAATEAGWQQTEIAALLGMKRQRVTARIMAARRIYRGHSPAIRVDEPRRRPRTVHEILRAPVPSRQWLSVAEAADHVQRSTSTVRNWDRRGILPNTDRRTPHNYLYLRADLDRVMSGPFRGRLGRYPDFDRLLEAIGAAAV